MTEIKFKGNPIHTSGSLPSVGTTAKDFALVAMDLSEARLSSFGSKKKVLNIFPSVDTGVCALSLKTFYKKLQGRDDVAVLNVSADLPFAFKRFCGAEGVENAVALSTFRSDFADAWGVKMIDGPLAGLCSRAIVVLNGNNQVVHTEQVPEIAQEPDYAAAIAHL
ncbi:MAG: thiol peroxidase [Planctomycetes bacterium]|nr:thiol peroxidase [Planctomycetota bacterium]